MPNFEVFTNQRTRRTVGPTLTIGRRGVFFLNEEAHAALGSPDAVELLYDRQASVIGLRAAAKTSPNAYAVRRNGTGSNYSLSGAAFLRYYGIPGTPTQRRHAEMRDGVLCVDLNVSGVVVTSNRARSDRPTRDEETE